MAYYFLFPEIDTTLYSHPDRSEMNAGSDEILEIVKERGSTDNILYPSRILIKFKNEEIKSVISDIITHDIYNNQIVAASLQLASAEPKNLLSTLNLYKKVCGVFHKPAVIKLSSVLFLTIQF